MELNEFVNVVEVEPVVDKNAKHISAYTTRDLMNEIMKRKGWSNKTTYCEFKKIFRK